ncbi:hypothetical protein SAMN05444396_106273 [Flavobacterium segetis]|uniref:Uncharacterized protein n=1 Tax=Flavobacterium segetis TaxID=271157 RepID=A0A1M5IAM6_9FLAO|nr:hypothetical protein SAMN05444396_106273 [Flavobacterium segetis]
MSVSPVENSLGTNRILLSLAFAKLWFSLSKASHFSLTLTTSAAFKH